MSELCRGCRRETTEGNCPVCNPVVPVASEFEQVLEILQAPIQSDDQKPS
jgi:hypothetical protein